MVVKIPEGAIHLDFRRNFGGREIETRIFYKCEADRYYIGCDIGVDTDDGCIIMCREEHVLEREEIADVFKRLASGEDPKKISNDYINKVPASD